MGLLFTPTMSWSAALEKLACQAQRSMYALYNYQKPFGHFNISQLLNLFDSMVKPVQRMVHKYGDTNTQLK